MSLFNVAGSSLNSGANPMAGQHKYRRGMSIIAASLVLGLAACFELSDADKSYNKGVGLLQEGQYEEAIVEFDRTPVLDDSMAAAFHNRAVAEERTGRLGSAIKDYTRSI